VFSWLCAAALVIALSTSLLSQWIVVLLFGREFAGSAPALALLVWTCPGLCLGVAQTNWFIAHGRPKGLMTRSLAAAAASVVLNLMLIPALGARGAALTMFLSQTIAHVGLNACFADTRPLFRMQCRAFVPFPLR
jgi:PST family polysaccharide transporter